MFAHATHAKEPDGSHRQPITDQAECPAESVRKQEQIIAGCHKRHREDQTGKTTCDATQKQQHAATLSKMAQRRCRLRIQFQAA